MCERMLLSLEVLAICMLPVLPAGCGRSTEPDDGRIVLTLPVSGGDRLETMYTELIAAFEKLHPDIHVKILQFPGSYWTKLQIMIAAGDCPDLLPMMTMRLPMYLHRGAFLPLDDLMKEDRDFQERLRTDIHPKVFSGFRRDGKLYGMPYSQNLYALYYNKTIFDKYNGTAPAEQKIGYPSGEWDLDTFVDAARKLTCDTNGDGRIDQYGTILPGLAFHVICPVLRRFGVELFSEDLTKCNLDRPEAIEAMQWYFDLANKWRVAPSPIGPDARSEGAILGGPADMFMAGKVAMWEAESEWRFELGRRIKTFEWDVAEPPHGRFRAAGFECFGICIGRDSRHPEAAWKFISFLTSPEGQKILLAHNVGIPILRSLCESPLFLDPNVPPAHKEVFLKTLEYGEDIPSLRNFQEVGEALVAELELAVIGKKSTADACRDATAQVDKLLKENPK